MGKTSFVLPPNKSTCAPSLDMFPQSYNQKRMHVNLRCCGEVKSTFLLLWGRG
jgi:hypothetical protein